MTHAIKSPGATREPVLAVGDLIEKQVGRTAIRLQRVTATVWTVVVEVGGFRVEDQCSSWGDEVAAALTASAYYRLALAEEIAAQAAEFIESAPVNPAAPLALGEVREHTAGDVTVTIAERPTGGFLVQLRRAGEMVRDACRFHVTDGPALAHFAALVAAHPAT